MITDEQLKKKINILTNKLKASLFDQVITEAKNLLNKRSHQVLYNILSVAYQSLGKFDLSVNIMEEALSKNPNNPFFLNNMGISQHKLKYFKKAEEYFKKGLEAAPKYINILNNLGNLKKDLNLTDEAIHYYLESIKIDDRLPETLLNLANVYNSIGKFEEAKIHFKKVLKINPTYTEAHRLISEITKYKIGDTHFEEMLSEITNQNYSPMQLAHLHFGIGKAYSDMNDYENSFNNYYTANNHLKEIIKYDIKRDIIKFKNIKKFFSNYQKISVKKNEKKIIFIVGMPRSGTSLTEQIISSHKDVFGGGELSFLDDIIGKKILKNDKVKDFNNPDLLKLIFEDSQDEYISQISEFDSSNNTFIDKSPLNFKYIGFIKGIFPNSKIINCNRNPVDICWSNYKNFFTGSLPFTNDLSDLTEFYNIYNDLINFWNSFLEKKIYNLNYNSLIQNPRNEIQRILKFCQLDWDENCLSHELNTKSIKTASFTQARKPIYKSAIGSSENYQIYLKELIQNIKS